VTTNAVVDERFVRLLGETPLLQELGSGFRSAEGPIWIAEEDALLFSDISADARRRWDDRSGVQVVAQPTACANGMTRDAEGRLVVCEHVTSSLVRMDAAGSGAGREVLATHYGGRELNSPNDVVVAADGSILFTDPPGGRRGQFGLEREQELDFMGVFRLPPGGEPLELLGTFEFPNGLCFSPDESLLYVNESAIGRVRVFDYAPAGPLGDGRVFADGLRDETGNVDGMKCDVEGNIWVTGRGGIWILGPDGVELGLLRVPDKPLNLHWGGPDWSVLFVTTASKLYRVQTKISGRREPFMH
jgi:gluconolactonase